MKLCASQDLTIGEQVLIPGMQTGKVLRSQAGHLKAPARAP